MQTSRTAVLQHDKSDKEEFVNVRHIRKTSLVSELLQHIGTAPKLYLRLEDLPDLNWPVLMMNMRNKMQKMWHQERSDQWFRLRT